MPKRSCRTLATGARQFVVQDALETMVCRRGSYLSSLTPITIVRSSFLAGAEMTTRRAPAARWALAFSASVNRPVDSTTYSAPRSFQGSWAGSLTASTFTERPATRMRSPSAETSSVRLPRMESYLRRWARVGASVMSLTATKSRSFSCRAARSRLRPMRPKPLMPTRVAMGVLLDRLSYRARHSVNGREGRRAPGRAGGGFGRIISAVPGEHDHIPARLTRRPHAHVGLRGVHRRRGELRARLRHPDRQPAGA